MFHGEIASRLNAPTEFRLLNPPQGVASQYVTVGVGSARDHHNVELLRRSLASHPSGGTPLCAHIQSIASDLRRRRATLDQRGQRCVVLIATDGCSTDGDLSRALKPLARLPCTVVVRLCTDDDSVVNYWNKIDDDLELELDVLDDLKGEAQECKKLNPWLTYCLPIHRIREFGAPSKLFDLLDERTFRPRELSVFVDYFHRAGGRSLSRQLDNGPEAFGSALNRVLLDVPLVVDPLRRYTKRPLIDIKLAVRLAKGERITGFDFKKFLTNPLLVVVAIIAMLVILFA